MTDITTVGNYKDTHISHILAMFNIDSPNYTSITWQSKYTCRVLLYRPHIHIGKLLEFTYSV